MNDQREVPSPYRIAGPAAHWIKAILQMLIGVVAGFGLVVWAVVEIRAHRPVDEISQGLFRNIGLALAVAATIELAYTLFTYGPDEALDPLMLGVSAALLIQLGQVEQFHWQEAVAALLYVIALSALFATRKYLADLGEAPTRHRPRRAPARYPALGTRRRR